ncbi:hypothetical protein FH972_010401 [Carpinus fangiana]|uniref:Apple domain-containing protein n=1 Tax=Carpinus fangiana TaxID=176857 RepID=A0A660KV58_9ROSI|nr:hypothetical protein FH972_010401 [Carpinus fangiana]
MLFVEEKQQPLQFILKSLGIERRTEAGFLEKEPTRFSVVDDKDGTFYTTFSHSSDSFPRNYVLNEQGNLLASSFNGEDWEVTLLALETECDVYGKCGAFGSCNSKNSPICSCLQGFEPKNTEEWNRGNWASGCVRRTPLQCERVNNGSDEGNKDGFLKLKMMKALDLEDLSSALEEQCRTQCLENCSCIAYAFDAGTGCISWTRSLIDLQIFSSGGVDLYVHLAYSELDKGGNVKVIITVTVIIGVIFTGICTYLLWRWMAKQKGNMHIPLYCRMEPPVPLYIFFSLLFRYYLPPKNE